MTATVVAASALSSPDPSSTVSELFVGPSLRKILIWRAFIFGGTDSKRARDAK
jgi:hypothetical protein